MNKRTTPVNLKIIFFIFSLTFLIACEENPPFTINTGNQGIDTSDVSGEIPIIKKDTIFTDNAVEPQQHIVFLEEFTGVSCINCPAGHAETAAILAAHPQRTIAAIIHAGFLTNPHPNSTQTFVTPETEALYNLLSVVAVPSAAIDRVMFPDEAYLAIVGKSKWGGRVIEQLEKTTPVNIYVNSDYNTTTRQVKIYVQTRFTESLNDALNLSVYLIENNVIDSQLLPDPVTLAHIIDDNYAHQHVVRDVVSATSGDALLPNNNTQNTGLTTVKTYTITLSETWNSDNCHVIAFVHQANDPRNVLQVAENTIGE